MATEKQKAMYLVNPDTGAVELVYGPDVADKKGAGFKEPEGMKANGTSWNTEDDEAAREAAADNARVHAKSQSEKDAKKAEELTEAYEANLKAAKEAELAPDMKVQIVAAPKAAATVSKRK